MKKTDINMISDATDKTESFESPSHISSVELESLRALKKILEVESQTQMLSVIRNEQSKLPAQGKEGNQSNECSMARKNELGKSSKKRTLENTKPSNVGVSLVSSNSESLGFENGSNPSLEAPLSEKNFSSTASEGSFSGEVNKKNDFDTVSTASSDSNISSKKSERKRKRTLEEILVEEVKENQKKKKSEEVYNPPKLKGNVDIFCWQCHKDGSVIPCKTCPRVFHIRCAKIEEKPVDWVCCECETTMKNENCNSRSQVLRDLTIPDLAKLLQYTIERMKSHEGSVYFSSPVDSVEYPQYKDFVVKPMDLSLLEANINRNAYGSTDSFVSDAKWLVHNSIIFNSVHSELTTIAKALVKIAKKETEEIESCPDCYLHAHTLEESWFVEPCSHPHLLVWAKLKGFPFWPCKVMKTVGNMIDARFFSDHNRAWVSSENCYLISKERPVSAKQIKSSNLDHGLEELELHIQKLKEAYGTFCYFPSKTSFKTRRLSFLRKEMLPEYEERHKAVVSYAESVDSDDTDDVILCPPVESEKSEDQEPPKICRELLLQKKENSINCAGLGKESSNVSGELKRDKELKVVQKNKSCKDKDQTTQSVDRKTDKGEKEKEDKAGSKHKNPTFDGNSITIYKKFVLEKQPKVVLHKLKNNSLNFLLKENINNSKSGNENKKTEEVQRKNADEDEAGKIERESIAKIFGIDDPKKLDSIFSKNKLITSSSEISISKEGSSNANKKESLTIINYNSSPVHSNNVSSTVDDPKPCQVINLDSDDEKMSAQSKDDVVNADDISSDTDSTDNFDISQVSDSLSDDSNIECITIDDGNQFSDENDDSDSSSSEDFAEKEEKKDESIENPSNAETKTSKLGDASNIGKIRVKSTESLMESSFKSNSSNMDKIIENVSKGHSTSMSNKTQNKILKKIDEEEKKHTRVVEMAEANENLDSLEPIIGEKMCRANGLGLCEPQISKGKEVKEIIQKEIEDILKAVTEKNDKEEILKILNEKLTSFKESRMRETEELNRICLTKILEIRNYMDTTARVTITRARELSRDIINYNKRIRWCIVCLKEAKFYCCWISAYCNVKCQSIDWPKHLKECTQNKMAVGDPYLHLSPSFQKMYKYVSENAPKDADYIDYSMTVSDIIERDKQLTEKGDERRNDDFCITFNSLPKLKPFIDMSPNAGETSSEPQSQVPLKPPETSSEPHSLKPHNPRPWPNGVFRLPLKPIRKIQQIGQPGITSKHQNIFISKGMLQKKILISNTPTQEMMSSSSQSAVDSPSSSQQPVHSLPTSSTVVSGTQKKVNIEPILIKGLGKSGIIKIPSTQLSKNDQGKSVYMVKSLNSFKSKTPCSISSQHRLVRILSPSTDLPMKSADGRSSTTITVQKKTNPIIIMNSENSVLLKNNRGSPSPSTSYIPETKTNCT